MSNNELRTELNDAIIEILHESWVRANEERNEDIAYWSIGQMTQYLRQHAIGGRGGDFRYLSKRRQCVLVAQVLKRLERAQCAVVVTGLVDGRECKQWTLE